MDKQQTELFISPLEKREDTQESSNAPWAHQLRPQELSEFAGWDHLLKRYAFLKGDKLPSLVLSGPPGVGKTTLARLLCKRYGKEMYSFSAVLGGVGDLRKMIERALEMKNYHQLAPAIFIDEIHRFNKAQQDALLPQVEAGDFTLIGATTENPRHSLNRALLSRLHQVELQSLSEGDLASILKRAQNKFSVQIKDEALSFLAFMAGGDARKALTMLETAFNSNPSQVLDKAELENLLKLNARYFDKDQDRHYDVISAFIKSMRGSDPSAALLWLAVMIDGGEDPIFIARRLVIFASEDVGNADPTALQVAVNALQVVEKIGLPEARITLGQATTYLASTHKSNAAYLGINEALSYVESNPNIQVPEHLKNYPNPRHVEKYKYPHDFPNHFVAQKYTVDTIPPFYRPTEFGREQQLKDRLDFLHGAKKSSQGDKK